MGTTGLFVHTSSAGHPILLPVVDYPKQLMLVTHVQLTQVLNVQTLFVLPDLQIVLGHVQQIPNLLHIELANGDLDFEFDGVRTLLDGCEEQFDLY